MKVRRLIQSLVLIQIYTETFSLTCHCNVSHQIDPDRMFRTQLKMAAVATDEPDADQIFAEMQCNAGFCRLKDVQWTLFRQWQPACVFQTEVDNGNVFKRTSCTYRVGQTKIERNACERTDKTYKTRFCVSEKCNDQLGCEDMNNLQI